MKRLVCTTQAIETCKALRKIGRPAHRAAGGKTDWKKNFQILLEMYQTMVLSDVHRELR